MAVPGSDQLGLYISIPFCRSKCTYCNFASGVFPAHEHARYVQRLIAEMRQARTWSESLGAHLPEAVDTIYLGGGTPSLLESEFVDQLFHAIRTEFSLSPESEITVECAPGQLSDDTLAAFVRAGVNRISLGVQSFIDSEARQSGRLHTRQIVLNDLVRLRSAGIRNLNLDLIAGLPGQTFASWVESVSTLISTGVPHASVYMLEVDDESRLGRELLSGGARYHADVVPTDDTIARMYEYAIEAFNDAGLVQYEISNFARSGHESSHNLRYWQRRPYLGLGLDASSMLRESTSLAESDESAYVLRSTTADDLNGYIAGSQPSETAWLSPDRQHEEAWFLGLRLNEGVSIAALRREFGHHRLARSLEIVTRLAARGLLTSAGPVVRLTPQGRLLSNDVFQEFLEQAGAEHASAAR
ncbi:radical SAM family heme chaperone HemW [Occallatibacter savannae]|uniref:radical SAM family heme chaperone HemW n=1 Tax=Occallatibacter savannae TaxID=1002691 RepID=UPI000D69C154|nr:radical SAM family heme chaperone HemW [Occallatibacter savannae]